MQHLRDRAAREKLANLESVLAAPDDPRLPDGSVDLYVGPKAPQGMESNWVQSLPGKSWFSYFRLYGPTEPFFNRSWVLNDFEEVK